jgi:hypothetical protein
MTNPAKVAEDLMDKNEDKVITLSTGIRARISPVPPALVDKIAAQYPDPEPPTVYIKSKDRHEVNELDPDYLKELRKAEDDRGTAATEAMIMFGIELVDGVPDPSEWLPKLEWLVKRGSLDLSEYDLDDESDLEFVYKAFVACGGVDIMKISLLSGLTDQEVVTSMAGFQSVPEPTADLQAESEAEA